MVDCKYCDQQIDAESRKDEVYLRHIASEHHRELSVLDESIVEKNLEESIEQITTEPEYRFSAGQIWIGVSSVTLFLGIIFFGVIL